MRKTLVLLILVLAGACSSVPPSAPPGFYQRPERQLSTYKGTFPADLGARIQAAPPEILKYLNKMDATDQYRAYVPSAEEVQLVRDYLAFLPQKIQGLMKESLVGIYFIENFIGGGMTDFLYDHQGRMFLALYLNPEILKKSLQEWILYRETSPFAPNPSWKIQVEVPGSYRGLLHTLVHEAAHMWDYVHRVTPYIGNFFKTPGTPKSSPFTQGFWLDHSQAQASYQIFGQSGYSGYGLARRIPSAWIQPLFTRWAQTPFASLYGAQNWAEDFAETFTWTFLKSKLGISYKITLFKEGQELGVYDPPRIQTPERNRVLQELLEG